MSALLGSARRHGFTLAYGLIVALAALLRLGGLTDVPHTLWVDEAWFGLKGREVVRGQDWLPLEPPGLGIGNSAYQIYAAALVQALGVPAAYSSRTASAATGVLVVAALYPTLLALWRGVLPEPGRQWGALAATAAMAMHFSGLLYSRGGGQMPASALAAVLVALGLYKTFASNRLRWAAFTGVVAGLGQNTYEAALGLPVWMAVYTGLRWLWPGALTRRRVLWLGGAAFLAAFLALAPFLVFFYFNPGIFLAHVGETQTVGRTGGAWASLLQAGQGLARVWLGVSFSGDELPGRNLVGRPFFDPFSSLLLWAGVARALWRARTPAFQLMLAWIGVMAIPSALSNEPPAFSRMLPMAPALCGFAGLTVAAAWEWTAARGRAAQLVTAGALAAGLALGGAASIHAYFVGWAGQPRLFDAIYFGARLTAEAALTQAAQGDVLVTTRSEPFVRYPFELLLGGSAVETFDATPDCLPYADGRARPTIYGVIQVIDPASLPALQAAYPQAQITSSVMHPDGYAYSVFLQVPAGARAPAPARPLDVEFAGGLRLTGYDSPAEARPGEMVTVRLYWAAPGPLQARLTGFVHLGRGRQSDPLLAQHDGPLCPGFTPDRWSAGFRYLETRRLTLPAEAAPGEYDLRVGVYDPTTGTRLAVTSASVPAEDDRAILTPFQVR